ncbi:hypothetical protein [Alkalihalobacillus sp. 1P02AB]|uniref:hypothetical protein n=1 Tax=Alkalihalobacillus sp. 1P02AB TaxID=3132260 RepID=UPI0039A52CF4
MNQKKNNIVICNLINGTSVRIPKIIRTRLGISSGDEIVIKTNNKLDGLILFKSGGNTKENQVVLSEDGRIWIPVELRRQLQIEKGTDFEIHINYNHEITLKVIKIK